MSGVVTVIQARTASTRLPGKVLLPLGDATVLDFMIARVRRARLAGRVVIATTQDPADDAIVALAEANGVACVRGPTHDLLDRHCLAGRTFGAAHVVKIPSDCPLIDPRAIDAVLGAHLGAGNVDYASNLHPPTWPDGNDVEIMRFDVLLEAQAEASQQHEREHTTPFVWSRPERFRLLNITWERGDHALSHRIVLDYEEDYRVITRIHDALAGGDFTAADIVAFLDAHPQVAATNAMHRGKAWHNTFSMVQS